MPKLDWLSGTLNSRAPSGRKGTFLDSMKEKEGWTGTLKSCLGTATLRLCAWPHPLRMDNICAESVTAGGEVHHAASCSHLLGPTMHTNKVLHNRVLQFVIPEHAWLLTVLARKTTQQDARVMQHVTALHFGEPGFHPLLPLADPSGPAVPQELQAMELSSALGQVIGPGS